jgi:hypothetical protein
VLNTSKQIGAALGLAALVAVAAGASGGTGLDHGAAFAAMSAVLLVAAAVTLALPVTPLDRASPAPRR